MSSMTPIKRLAALWSTATFRLALVFTLIFGFGSAALLVALNVAVSRFAENEIRQALQHQLAIMRADVDLEGGDALASMLNEHSLNDDISRYSYYVVSPDGKVFGNGLPRSVTSVHGARRIHVMARDPAPGNPGHTEAVTFMVLTGNAADGTFMAVGRDISPLQQLQTGLTHVALWGALGLVILAVAAGTAASLLFLRRMDRVNAAAARLAASPFSERLPSIGFGSEFDSLARNLNRMLDRLEAAVTALRQVSADVAHDLRTPLTRLRNQLEDAAGGDTGRIADAIAETDEILRIFNALLRIAQVEGGDVRRAFLPIDLCGIVQRVADIYQPVAEEGGRSLTVTPCPSALIQGDDALLQQTLVNLVENALIHAPPQTRVSVELTVVDGRVVLAVSDDGPGVPQAELRHITRRFYRLDASSGTPGAGLGLPLVIAVADLHHATVNITGNDPGLRIELSFPAANPAAGPAYGTAMQHLTVPGT